MAAAVVAMAAVDTVDGSVKDRGVGARVENSSSYSSGSNRFSATEQKIQEVVTPAVLGCSM